MRILIVKTSSLGDIIHTFPVLDYLKKWNPACKIDWIVEKKCAELVIAHPFVHQALLIQSKRWRTQFFNGKTWREMSECLHQLHQSSYDIVFDLQGNMKSALVTACASSQMKVGFDYRYVSEWPNLLVTNKKIHPPPGHNIREDYLYVVRSVLGDLPHSIGEGGIRLILNAEESRCLKWVVDRLKTLSGLKILVCPGSNWVNKQLTKEALRIFLENCSRHLNAYFLLVWGDLNEKTVAEEVALSLPDKSLVIDRLSLPALQNLMAQVDLVIAMDSLPLHLAGTTLTPTYSVFGASSSLKYNPIGPMHKSFQGKCPYGRIFEKRCEVLRTCTTGACIKSLNGNQLFEHFYNWWCSSSIRYS
ncbi:MAG: glycosyltransferase family 9 protein [Parachlamydiaceae bacterium]